MKALARFSLFLLLAAAAAAPAYAQGCTMCYTAAAQQSAQGKHALNMGILMLLLPAIGMFCGLFFLVWRSKEAPVTGVMEDRVQDYEEAWRR